MESRLCSDHRSQEPGTPPWDRWGGASQWEFPLRAKRLLPLWDSAPPRWKGAATLAVVPKAQWPTRGYWGEFGAGTQSPRSAWFRQDEHSQPTNCVLRTFSGAGAYSGMGLALPVVPASQEAEAGGSLEPGSLRPAWAVELKAILKTNKS